MPFENVQILSKRNGFVPIIGAREDLLSTEVITIELTDYTNVSSQRWEIKGRPEYSVVGGGGANPWLLGTGAGATFTVDSDSGTVKLDGTYVVECTLNPGSPSETRISTELARVSGLTIPGLYPLPARSLRKLGMFESMEDIISISQTLGGWSTMLNRWLDALRSVLAGGSGTFPGYGSGAPETIESGDAGAAGSSGLAARFDHGHPVTTPTVSTDISGSASAVGSSIKLAREDHTHKGVLSINGLFGAVSVATFGGFGGAPVDVTKAAAAAGSASTASRSDHKHDISTGTPGTITIGASAAQGSATSLARSDHAHAVTASATPQDVGSSNAAGSSSNIARDDHTHRGVTSLNSSYGALTLSALTFIRGLFKFSGQHLGVVSGLVTSYTADMGDSGVALANIVQYPMPDVTVRNLRVAATVNALATAATVTVMKNGSATSISVTISAGSTSGVSDLTNTSAFGSGDLLDLRVQSTSSGLNTMVFAATLEIG